MKDDQRNYSRLLSERPGWSIQEKETALNTVLTRIEREEQTSSVGLFGSISNPIKIASVVVLALLCIPVLYLLSSEPEDDGFRKKGAMESMPLFSVRCVDKTGVKNICRPGNKLIFNVHPPEDKPHFSAFARRETDGLIIWYFPATENETSFDIGPNNTGGILSKGVVIGEEHTSGTYEVFGIFSEKPATRNEIKSKFNDNLRLKDNSYVMSNVHFLME